MAQVQGSEATCICSEEDLQRVIELEAWYDSEGESSSESETEETDSSPNLNYYSIEVRDILAHSTDSYTVDSKLLVPRQFASGCS